MPHMSMHPVSLVSTHAPLAGCDEESVDGDEMY